MTIKDNSQRPVVIRVPAFVFWIWAAALWTSCLISLFRLAPSGLCVAFSALFTVLWLPAFILFALDMLGVPYGYTRRRGDRR